VPSDNFEECAKRHLDDANFLFKNNRLDNAMHLAGFAVECSLKFAVKHYQGYGLRDPRAHYKHKVHLIATDLIRTLSLLPNSSAYSILNQIQPPRNPGHPLHGHPDRRYWSSGYWSQSNVRDAIKLAQDVYQKIVVPIQTLGRLP